VVGCEGKCGGCGIEWTKRVCPQWGSESQSEIAPLRCLSAMCAWHKAYQAMYPYAGVCWHGPYDPGQIQDVAHKVAKLMDVDSVFLGFGLCMNGFMFVVAHQKSTDVIG